MHLLCFLGCILLKLHLLDEFTNTEAVPVVSDELVLESFKVIAVKLGDFKVNKMKDDSFTRRNALTTV